MTVLVLLGTAVLAAAAAAGRPRLTLGVLVASVALVPGTLVVPHAPTAALTCARVIEVGAVVGVLRARRRTPLAAAPAAPTAAVLLLLFLGATALTGIGLADPLTDQVAAAYSWMAVAEQAVALLLALELGRRVDPRLALGLLAGGAVVAAGLGLVEAVTHASYARALFRASPGQLGTFQAGPLEQRDGSFRSRGATDFALAYGWVLAALVPAVVLFARESSRRATALRVELLVLLGGAAGAAVLGAVFASRSRSPLVGSLLVLLVLALVLAPRHPLGRLGLVGLLVGLGVVLAPTVSHRLSPSVDAGSVDVRVQRLPDVLQLAAQHPVRGSGLTSITRLGLGGVDASYLLTYVETGVVAVVLLVGALVAALLSTARALPGDDDADRSVVLAAVLGMLALAAGGLTFDTFTVLPSEWVFWLLAGLGLSAANRRRGPERRLRPRRVLSSVTFLTVVLGVNLGLLVQFFVPTHAEAQVVFDAVSPAVQSNDLPRGLGRTLVTTFCQTARELAAPGKDWTVGTCSELDPPGWGRLRIEAKGRDAAQQGTRDVVAAARLVPGLEDLRLTPTASSPRSGRPTVVAVAPTLLGCAAFVLWLLPWPVRSRSAAQP